MRSSSTALSKSPSASSRAFLHSIIPAEVRSRSFLTSAAVMVAMVIPILQIRDVREEPAARPARAAGLRRAHLRPPENQTDYSAESLDSATTSTTSTTSTGSAASATSTTSTTATASTGASVPGQELALPLGQRLLGHDGCR